MGTDACGLQCVGEEARLELSAEVCGSMEELTKKRKKERHRLRRGGEE